MVVELNQTMYFDCTLRLAAGGIGCQLRNAVQLLNYVFMSLDFRAPPFLGDRMAFEGSVRIRVATEA